MTNNHEAKPRRHYRSFWAWWRRRWLPTGDRDRDRDRDDSCSGAI